MLKFALSMIACAAAVAVAGIAPAHAATFKVNHNFCVKADCTDGSTPIGAPVADASGIYYGVTNVGGINKVGTIFKAEFQSGDWHFTRIHSFCAKTDCTDGANPAAGLVIDTHGNLFGTTSQGGANAGGTMFELSRNGGKWTYRVLYSFCSATNCVDGKQPLFGGLSYQGQASGTPYDGTTPLFGVTLEGGNVGAGVVFALTPKGKNWNEKAIYSFCSLVNCSDGGVPYAGVLVDGNGNLFGGAGLGGASADSDMCCGTLYELSPHGTNWKYTTLHVFCSDKVGDICTDGRIPFAAPIMDAEGNLYGTTIFGGAGDMGVAYKLVPNGVRSKFTVLHNFCAKTNCADGAAPYAGPLVMDAAGTLYGTTSAGGSADAGLVFSLGGAKLTTFKILNVFKGGNGSQPYTGLTLDPSGTLYGLATGGGKHIGGVFYSVMP